MLNYFLGKKIETLIENSILNNLDWFKSEVKCKILNQDLSEKDELIFMCVHKQLIENIVIDVTNFMKGNPPNIYTKYTLTMTSPSICGYDFFNEEMSLGILYCVVYYAYTGKKAKSVTASKQNHILYAYTNKVFKELDDENTSAL